MQQSDTVLALSFLACPYRQKFDLLRTEPLILYLTWRAKSLLTFVPVARAVTMLFVESDRRKCLLASCVCCWWSWPFSLPWRRSATAFRRTILCGIGSNAIYCVAENISIERVHVIAAALEATTRSIDTWNRKLPTNKHKLKNRY